jgi:hypothetical protein
MTSICAHRHSARIAAIPDVESAADHRRQSMATIGRHVLASIVTERA